jgi:D-alanyl-D-alanine carboxypeptidase/D-alanyl-D-alanine-endopeptidase (penicillin-binding protein 4)
MNIRHLIISFSLCLAVSSHAQTAGLEQAVKTFASDPVFSHAHIGIKAVRADGECIVEYNEEKMLAPASNMKLISTGAALFSLGPEYRFSTELAYDGHISDGVLHGSLYIVGGADPVLGSKDSVAVVLTETFSQWEQAVRRAGITRIEGRIIGDGRWLDGMGSDPTWQQEDLGTYYGTSVSGLMFYENMMSFSVSAGASVGEPVKIAPYYPSCSWMEFRYPCTTGGKGTGDKLYMYASEFAPIAEIRGTFGVDRAAKRLDCCNMFPEYTCAVYFKNYLASKGISCSGGAADFKLRREWISSGVQPCGLGTDGDSLKVIDRFYSPSLARIAFKTNHESNNLLAETLFRTLGKENRGSSCIDSSYVAMNTVLKKMHVGSSGLSMQDGSGLSRVNLVSADFMCRFLGAMMDSPCFEEYLWSLPSPGGNGTLQYNMKGIPAEQRARFRVKSGSMNGVRCYSGYILPADFVFVAGTEIPQEVKDKIIVFSILTNNCTSPSWKVRPMLDKMMLELAE